MDDRTTTMEDTMLMKDTTTTEDTKSTWTFSNNYKLEDHVSTNQDGTGRRIQLKSARQCPWKLWNGCSMQQGRFNLLGI